MHPRYSPASAMSQESLAPSVSAIQVADFRLQKDGERGWKISVVSTRASYWLRANQEALCDPDKRLSIAEANDFLKVARRGGMKTEYVGPVEAAVL